MQITPRQKQLIVLLVVAAWVSYELFRVGSPKYGPNGGGLGDFTFNEAVVGSIPAILFGAILFWWFRRSSNE
jgi:hypothetical protein